jgi:DNA processing protein
MTSPETERKPDTSDLYYRMALTLVPHIGDMHHKALLQHFGSAEGVFRAKKHELEKIPGVGSVRAASIRRFDQFNLVESEMRFMEKYRIRALNPSDEDYPKRLVHCPDAPSLLYFRGTGGLNSPKILSIIGTRTPTDYGRELVRQLTESLAPYSVVIVSGLAYGIDTQAHKAALKCNLPTIGILAHGLDRIYPPANKHLAREMIEQGGLLTDFMSNTQPDPPCFVRRNRIIAGIADAVVVIETGIKGGSMITADMANGYNKDVFTFPGRVTDPKCEGCNRLISDNKACLLTCGQDLIRFLNWENAPRPVRSRQSEIFAELSPDQRLILSLLGKSGAVPLDRLYLESGLKYSEMAAAILKLELEGQIVVMPGKQVRLT